MGKNAGNDAFSVIENCGIAKTRGRSINKLEESFKNRSAHQKVDYMSDPEC